jgi:hypothetical protein
LREGRKVWIILGIEVVRPARNNYGIEIIIRGEDARK